MPRKFKISVVRYADKNYKKEIDRILIHCDLDYAEAIDTLEHLMFDNKGFSDKHRESVISRLRKKDRSSSLCQVGVLTPELHGNLGYGG